MIYQSRDKIGDRTKEKWGGLQSINQLRKQSCRSPDFRQNSGRIVATWKTTWGTWLRFKAFFFSPQQLHSEYRKTNSRRPLTYVHVAHWKGSVMRTVWEWHLFLQLTLNMGNTFIAAPRAVMPSVPSAATKKGDPHYTAKKHTDSLV